MSYFTYNGHRDVQQIKRAATLAHRKAMRQTFCPAINRFPFYPLARNRSRDAIVIQKPKTSEGLRFCNLAAKNFLPETIADFQLLKLIQENGIFAFSE